MQSIRSPSLLLAALWLSRLEVNMNLDDFEFNEEDANAAERRREEMLLLDEVPLDTEGADDCDSGACAI